MSFPGGKSGEGVDVRQTEAGKAISPLPTQSLQNQVSGMRRALSEARCLVPEKRDVILCTELEACLR